VQASEVSDLLKRTGAEWLDAVDITDLFEHESEGQTFRAVTFILRYRNDESERSTDQLNAETERLARAVVDTLGSRGVSQRS
jgi:phenylalanyl-tRNA synthetase beta subunit